MKNSIVIILLLFAVMSFGQETDSSKIFYKDEKGRLISQIEYDELKAKIITGFKGQGANVRIEDSFRNIEKKNDSIIKTYKFNILPLDSSGKDKKRSGNKPSFGEHLIGKPLPLTTLKNIDGSDLIMSDLIGKPTMINFWFTNCKPCIDEFPVLNNLKKKYSDKVNFISITFDDKEKTEKLIQKFPFEFKKFIDAKEYVDKLKLVAFPTSLFIDKKGVVKYAEGGIPYIFKNGKREIGDGKEFETIIKKLLNTH